MAGLKREINCGHVFTLCCCILPLGIHPCRACGGVREWLRLRKLSFVTTYLHILILLILMLLVANLANTK